MRTILQYTILILIFLTLPLILTVLGCLFGFIVQYALIKIAFVLAKEKTNENESGEQA